MCQRVCVYVYVSMSVSLREMCVLVKVSYMEVKKLRPVRVTAQIERATERKNQKQNQGDGVAAQRKRVRTQHKTAKMMRMVGMQVS